MVIADMQRTGLSRSMETWLLDSFSDPRTIGNTLPKPKISVGPSVDIISPRIIITKEERGNQPLNLLIT